jgi:putative component of membrane protein insertase Oxa1/YidC/SpoIIIJ protein YidD
MVKYQIYQNLLSFFLGLRCTFEPPDANVDVMRQKLNQKSKGA